MAPWIWAALRGRRLSGPARALFEAAGARPPRWSQVEPILFAPDVARPIAEAASALLEDDAGLAAVTDGRLVTRQGNAPERLAFYALSRLLGREAFARRRRVLDDLPATDSPLEALRIDRRSGVLVTAQGAWAPVAEAVEEARAAFAAPSRTSANAAKPFLATAKFKGDVLESKVMALGRHPAMLRLVGRYLEGLPILYRINLLESSNDHLEDASSQFFHLDPEDFRQVKVFLLVEDVDEQSGPLHLLEAAASDEVRLRLSHRHGRISDEAGLAAASPAALVRCTGPAGTLAIGDTSRCFHFGSRPGRRRRYVVMYQYVTPFACSFPLDARDAASKYRQPMLDRGQPLTETERLLFAIER